ncbi:ATPase [Proteobacteria bacterium 005FR1]|nr:ATPase [Proteobacteria bacterium 005FR1]
MKVEKLHDLVEWTRQTHQHLGEAFARAGDSQQEARAKHLLQYLADHEKRLAGVVSRFEQEASAKALDTWVGDYLSQTPIDPQRTGVVPYESMSFDEIATAVVDTHDQIIDLYRYLKGRADNPEARQLAEDLLSMEEQEAVALADQANR